MKEMIFYLSFLFSACILSQPVFYVEKQTIHFGNVIQKSEVEGEFLIENRGNEVLEFKEVVPYCNCTILSMPEKIPPNGRERLVFAITPKIAEGDWRTVIKIKTNENKENIHKLTITMNVIPILKFEPSPNEPITILPDENFDKVIKIYSPSFQEFSILDFSLVGSEELLLEEITPLGKKITQGSYFTFKAKSSKPLKIGDNFFNIKFKTDLEKLPTVRYNLKINVKSFLFAEPDYLSFSITPKPGILTPIGNNKFAYPTAKKEEKPLFKLKQEENYKIMGTVSGWYQIQDPSTGLFGWIPWEDVIIKDNGYVRSTKIFSANNIPFKIKSINCPEKFFCNYEEKGGSITLYVQRYAPLENLKEDFGIVEILTNHPKQERLMVPLTEEKIEKYKDTKTRMKKKIRLNEDFQEKKQEMQRYK